MAMKKYLSSVLAVTVIIGMAFAGAFLLAELAPVEITPLALSPAKTNTSSVLMTQLTTHKAGEVLTTSQRQRDEDFARVSTTGDQQSPQAEIAPPLFNAEAIFEATQKVRLDDSGNVVLDHDTMVLLHHTLGQADLALDELALAELKDLIQYALPDPSGSQVALVAGNYYEFIRAKKEYDELAESNDQNSDYGDRQRSIQRLRETYLGAEVADKLFSQSDAENELMRAHIELSANKKLTPEQRQQQMEGIQRKYVDSVLQANGWQDRYQQFSQAKKALTSAGEDSASHQQAITELWHAHFTQQEREKMATLQMPTF